MKKILIFITALLVMLSASIPVFAAPNGFNVSPGAVIAPELVEFDKLTEDCLATLIITAYAERNNLPADKKADIEKAYDDIVNASNIADLCASFASFVATLGIDVNNLAVSDLFDVSYYNCDIHEEHDGFTIKIKPDTLTGFVGLLHSNGGVWEHIDNAKITDDGTTLTFTVDELSPFAIVVEKDSGSTDDTGDSYPMAAIILLAISGVALAVVAVSFKKSRA